MFRARRRATSPVSGGFCALEPGPWFNSVSPEEFTNATWQLNALDAAASVAKILELAGDCVPVLCCYEAPDPAAPWCHRGQVAAWLFDRLGLEVRRIRP